MTKNTAAPAPADPVHDVTGLVPVEAILDALHRQLPYPTEACAIVRATARAALTPLPVAPETVEGEAGTCYLCAGKCRGHGLGHPREWEPEPGSQAARDIARQEATSSSSPPSVTIELRELSEMLGVEARMAELRIEGARGEGEFDELAQRATKLRHYEAVVRHLLQQDAQPSPEMVMVKRDDLQFLASLACKHVTKSEQPDRIKVDGEWYYGPPATAFLQLVQTISDAASAMLSAHQQEPNDGR